MTDPSQLDPQSVAEAQKAVDANVSPRWRTLARLEAYVAGTQYAGQQHWIWPTVDCPLAERGPHVVEPIAQNAIASYLDLLLGEGRWPVVKIQTGEDEESDREPDSERAPRPKRAPVDAFDQSMALAEDEREGCEKFLDTLITHTRLPFVASEALGAAMACGTVVSTVGAKRGKLVVENLSAKWCTPTWSESDADVLESLEIRYPFTTDEWDHEAKKWARKTKLYRRVIDATTDTTFKSADADKRGGEPSWSVATKIEHGYGFVPAVWYAFDRKLAPAAQRDGHAIHADLLDEIDALNRAESQHNRAALYAGDPQFVEIGVAEGHNPTGSGRAAQSMAAYGSENPTVAATNSSWGVGGSGSTGDRRRKGPGVVWRYDNPNVKVELLSLPEGALKAIASDRDDLRNMIADSLGWVRDREPGASGSPRFTGLSGEALRWMMQKQLSRCDRYRQDFGDGWLLPVLRLALRCVMHHASTPGKLYLSGAQAMGQMLGRFVRQTEMADGTTAAEWFDPPLLLDWPAYFPPTDQDKAVVAKQAREDLDAGLITLETAVSRIEPFYQDIPPANIAEYVEELKEAKAERTKSLGAALAAIGPAAKENVGGDEQEPESVPPPQQELEQ